jgi:hypothetical protein
MRVRGGQLSGVRLGGLRVIDCVGEQLELTITIGFTIINVTTDTGTPCKKKDTTNQINPFLRLKELPVFFDKAEHIPVDRARQIIFIFDLNPALRSTTFFCCCWRARCRRSYAVLLVQR